MVLRVALEDFAEAVRKYADTDETFVAASGGGTQMSSVNPNTGVIVSCTSELEPAEVRQMLEAADLKVREGEWSRATEGEAGPEYHLAAVAYRSKDPTPGLWVDAFSRPPTVMEVLRGMYEEFSETGEAGEASFEQFVNSAQPNVLILSPDELRAFVVGKD